MLYYTYCYIVWWKKIIGAFGSDPNKAGLCYKITADGIDRDLIVQVVDKSYSSESDFGLILADGGLGSSNACVFEGSSIPQFYSTEADWGNLFGGWSSIDQCSYLPSQPICGLHPKDDLQRLCKWTFSKKFRLTNSDSSPVINNMCSVKCPEQLWKATGIHRLDEPTSSFTCTTDTIIPSNGQLTSRMNCGKPAYAFDGQASGYVDPAHSVVVPCRRDGYARINAVPTVAPTPAPTSGPSYTATPSYRNTSNPSPISTIRPTIKTKIPSAYPTKAPSYKDPLCCDTTFYNTLYDTEWEYCKNAADPSLGNVTSCSTCVSYSCIDWTAMSAGMKSREQTYFEETGDQVYFGVGSYGNDQTKGKVILYFNAIIYKCYYYRWIVLQIICCWSRSRSNCPSH